MRQHHTSPSVHANVAADEWQKQTEATQFFSHLYLYVTLFINHAISGLSWLPWNDHFMFTQANINFRICLFFK